MKEALIIIDVQNDYFEGGKMELKNPLKALKNIKKIAVCNQHHQIPYFKSWQIYNLNTNEN